MNNEKLLEAIEDAMKELGVAANQQIATLLAALEEADEENEDDE